MSKKPEEVNLEEKAAEEAALKAAEEKAAEEAALKAAEEKAATAGILVQGETATLKALGSNFFFPNNFVLEKGKAKKVKIMDEYVVGTINRFIAYGQISIKK